MHQCRGRHPRERRRRAATTPRRIRARPCSRPPRRAARPGRGLVPELIAAGHQVTGLARSDAAARSLRAAGAGACRGSLDDPGVLREAAAASDGVVHLAFKHDIAFAGDFAGATAADRVAIETFGEALAGTGKPLVIASGILGVLGLPPGAVATERDGLAAADGDREAAISGASERVANAHYPRMPPRCPAASSAAGERASAARPSQGPARGRAARQPHAGVRVAGRARGCSRPTGRLPP